MHYFSYFCSKHRLLVLIRTTSLRQFYRVPTIYVLSGNMKNIRFFFSENFHFLVVKFSVHLNRCVFIMNSLFPRFRPDRPIFHFSATFTCSSFSAMHIFCATQCSICSDIFVVPFYNPYYRYLKVTCSF